MQKHEVKNKEDFIKYILLDLFNRVHAVPFGRFFMEINPSGGIDSFRNLLDELYENGFVTRSSEPNGNVPGFPGLQTIDLRYAISLKGIQYLKDNSLTQLIYSTAYEILARLNANGQMTRDYFSYLIKDFQSEYLKCKQYKERLALHRNPAEVKNEILRDLYDYTQQIQFREEMREIDPVKNSSGYVPTKVMEIWRANKNLKSLYSAILEYCNLRNKDFNIIAVHIAEYRAMNKLIGKIRLSMSKRDSPKKGLEIEAKEHTKKRRAKIPQEAKIRAELQKEINSHCPFCDNADVGHFEIHHIDSDPSNNQNSNLLLLCPICHSKIHKGDIALEDVINKKNIISNNGITKSERNVGRIVNFNSTVTNAIVGNNNTIKITPKQKSIKQKYPADCIGFDSVKSNYVSHLISRYNEYKEYEVGKDEMSYGFFSSHLKKKFKIGPTRTLYNLPIAKFDELVQYIQYRIDNTKLGKQKGKNHKNYSTFEEYQA